MISYTPTIHYHRLKAILELDSCNCCPASLNFSPAESAGLAWKLNGPNSCRVCCEFIDLEYPNPYGCYHWRTDNQNCPCNRLGHDKAIKRSVEAIEAWEAGTHPMSEVK